VQFAATDLPGCTAWLGIGQQITEAGKRLLGRQRSKGTGWVELTGGTARVNRDLDESRA
jgi:hypothetical protein